MTVQDYRSRIDGLIARMTLREKVGQLNMVTSDWVVTGPRLSADYLAAVRAGEAGSLLNLWGATQTREMQRIAVEETRLGIPLLLGFDVVHGHRTIFPVPLGEASAFDPELWERTARAAAEEAAADGLNLTFAPMLDVSRDPRWGRIVEGPGEDPVVATQFGLAKVRGFQGADLAFPDTLAATAKHLGAYGAVLAGRDYASADVSERLLHEVYYAPFRPAVDAGTAAIMPSFNDIAGVPVTANRSLLRDLVRTGWGFDGVVISDYNAIAELLKHGVAADIPEAAALALKAGVDIDMMGNAYLPGLPAALERGLVTMGEIDEAVGRVLALKGRLGLFDDPYRGGAKPLSLGRCQEIRSLAREAARRSVVLLTNRNEVLPLAPGLARIALLGPLCEDAADMLGSWSGAGKGAEAVPILAGLRQARPDADIQAACGTRFKDEGEDPDESGITPALEFARSADLIILCLGESAKMNGEASSRAEPCLPPLQRKLADGALALGKPVVLVLSSGRPLVLGSLAERADAILATWHLGHEAGHAIADILTGRAGPSGRLPISWPADVGQIPIYFSRRPTGRPAAPDVHYSSKYLDVPVEPLFPFGHGLAYTSFSWGPVRLSTSKIRRGETVDIEAEVVNLGQRSSEETGFLFIRDPVASIARPLLEFKQFTRLPLDPGQTGTVRFKLRTDDLAFLGPAPDFAPCLEDGEFEVLVGPSANRSLLRSAALELW